MRPSGGTRRSRARTPRCSPSSTPLGRRIHSARRRRRRDGRYGMTRVAAIDCGTNSVRLLVADVDTPVPTDVVRRMEIVRLGRGVDKTGRLAPEAIEATRVALAEYAAQIRDLGATRT